MQYTITISLSEDQERAIEEVYAIARHANIVYFTRPEAIISGCVKALVSSKIDYEISCVKSAILAEMERSNQN